MTDAVNLGYNEKVINEDPEFTDNKTYKEYRKKWYDNPKKMIVDDKPLYIAIESTNNCNLVCGFCPRIKMMKDGCYNRTIGFMKWDLYKKIIDEIAELGVYSIKLNKDGEPLMHPDITRMVKYAKEKGILEVMFNTNALMLNESMCKKLIEARLDKILISFDSPNKEKYNMLRTGSDYDLVLRNVRMLKKLKDKSGGKPYMRVNMIRMSNTPDDEIKKFNALFGDVADILAIQDYSDIDEKKTLKKDLVCQDLFQRLIILWNGKVIPCCGDYMEDYVLGDANKDNIADIWKSEKLNKLRELHKAHRCTEVEMCRKCSYHML